VYQTYKTAEIILLCHKVMCPAALNPSHVSSYIKYIAWAVTTRSLVFCGLLYDPPVSEKIWLQKWKTKTWMWWNPTV